MTNKYRHLFALSLMVFSLSLISCTVNDISSSNSSTSSSTTTSSQDEKLNFQINIHGEGQANAYFDGISLNSANFDDVVDVNDIVVIDCQKSFGYYLDQILINQESMEKRDNYYIFNVVDGDNIVDVYFEKIETSIDDFSFQIENDEAILIDYEQPNVTLIPDPVVIPDEVTIDNVTYPVTKIGEYALSNRDVRSYQIGKNIKSIATYAFGFLSNNSLEYIYVSDENTNFISDDGILYDKVNHKLIKAGGNYQKEEITLLDDTLTIASDALSHLKNVKEIHLNEGLEKIEDYALSYNNVLSITIPNSVTDIGECAFQYSALEEITLSNNLKTLGAEAFSNCNLKSIEIPSSLQIIPEYAFYYCRSLNNITFNEGLLEIQDQAFVTVPIKTITFPNSLKRIGNSVFSQCFNLINVNFNDGLEEIGNYAFERANNIEKIHLPSSLTHIGYNPFAGILRLGQNNNFTIEENSNFEIVDSVLYQNTENGKILITYPMGKTNNNFVIDKGVIRLENASFMYQRSLFNLTLPTSITSIGDAFESMYLDMPSSDETYSLTINYLGSVAQFQQVELSSNWHGTTPITNNAIICNDGLLDIY